MNNRVQIDHHHPADPHPRLRHARDLGAWLRGQDGYVALRQALGGLRGRLRPGQAPVTIHSPPDATYSYSVWARHMSLANQFGPGGLPRGPLVELGPGETLGVGLCSLLTGSESYWALDAARFVDLDHQREVFRELVELFRQRAPVPAGDAFPRLKPPLFNYGTPCAAGTADLSEERLASIDRALARLAGDVTLPDDGPVRLRYFTAADAFDRALGRDSVDTIISQAVMEYMPDLHRAYADQRRWLAPGGWVSHQIDLSAHETAAHWNGHWAIPRSVWWLIRGGKPFFLNRAPFSAHVDAMAAAGLEVLATVRMIDRHGIARPRLAPDFRTLSDDDLSVRGAWILARRPQT